MIQDGGAPLSKFGGEAYRSKQGLSESFFLLHFSKIRSPSTLQVELKYI